MGLWLRNQIKTEEKGKVSGEFRAGNERQGLERVEARRGWREQG